METSKRDIAVFPVPKDKVLPVLDEAMGFLAPAADTTEGTVSPQHLRDQIAAGRYGLWAVTEGKQILGFFTLEAMSFDDGDWVNIPFAGFKKDLAAMSRSLEEIERVSQATGFKGVKWISADTRFEAYAARKGYRPRLVEYVKEFE